MHEKTHTHTGRARAHRRRRSRQPLRAGGPAPRFLVLVGAPGASVCTLVLVGAPVPVHATFGRDIWTQCRSKSPIRS